MYWVDFKVNIRSKLIVKVLSKTLKEMLKESVVVEVERSEGWSSKVVFLEKPNKTIRICIDNIELNIVIVRYSSLIKTSQRLIFNKNKNKYGLVLLTLRQDFGKYIWILFKKIHNIFFQISLLN